jgi:hypothetical protein
MQIKLRQASLAGPSQRSSAAKPLIANIFQETDLVHRHCDSPLDGPRATPAIPHAYRLRPLSDLTQDPAGHSIHIGHALGSGFVQSIFSPPSRRPPFRCFPSVSRRDADLKILCIGLNRRAVSSGTRFREVPAFQSNPSLLPPERRCEEKGMLSATQTHQRKGAFP